MRTWLRILKTVYGVETKIIPPWAAADLTPEVIPPPRKYWRDARSAELDVAVFGQSRPRA